MSGVPPPDLIAVCRTCNKYWKDREQKGPSDPCAATDGCGGPRSGDVYHEYEGPVTDFTRFCFVCGVEPRFHIRVGPLLRVLGACKVHMDTWIPSSKTVESLGRKLPVLELGEKYEEPKTLGRLLGKIRDGEL